MEQNNLKEKIFMNLTLDDVLKATKGTLKSRGTEVQFKGVSIDSRVVRPGEVFVAIKGSHFDGNNFVGEAVAKGAPAVITASPAPAPANVSVVRVRDTVDALGDLASWWRGRFKVPCVAITGSNGKSTTKEMAAAIAACRGNVLKTEGNFNNLIGLPLTVFRWEKEHDVAILEMGMNAKGEIKKLTRVARPDIGLITNITAAHLEKLHSVEGVAQAKGELFEEMGVHGTVIINDEDPWVKKLGAKFSGRKITFGMQNTSDVRFLHMESRGLDDTELKFAVKGREYKIKVPLPGTHNVMNALSAIAIGVALGIEADEMLDRLKGFHPMAMRFERVQLSNGVCLVNDSYNANPQSMRAAFRTVGAAKRAGRFVAVLGDMLELGEQSAKLHREVGAAAVESGVQILFVIGSFAAEFLKGARESGMGKEKIHEYQDIEELEKAVEKEIRAGDILLVKGSRAMRMERIVDYLKHNVGCG
jgi:UDP-N-acetylmuramoyl-tripeptide--D-alanyl-D-alanine ligase